MIANLLLLHVRVNLLHRFLHVFVRGDEAVRLRAHQLRDIFNAGRDDVIEYHWVMDKASGDAFLADATFCARKLLEHGGTGFLEDEINFVTNRRLGVIFDFDGEFELLVVHGCVVCVEP